MDWIPVSERLPEPSGDNPDRTDEVLVCTAAGRRDIGRYNWRGYMDCTNWWDCRQVPGDYVTHWQPLEDPPVEAVAPTGKGPTSNPSQP